MSTLVTIDTQPHANFVRLHDPTGKEQFVTELSCALRKSMPQHRPFCVVVSEHPRFFHLGGDLEFFAQERTSAELKAYANQCIDVVWALYSGIESTITAAAVTGEALGGGFELALACDIIVASRDARMGLPEARFNFFPGMGAYSFLTCKVGPLLARRMCESGETYSAQMLHSLGVVDYLVENPEAFFRKPPCPPYAMFARILARKVIQPIELTELREVVNIWVSNILQLSAADRERMRRVARLQSRAVKRGDIS